MNCTKQHFDSAAGFAVHYVREHSHPIMDYTRGLIQSAAEFVIDYIKQLLHSAVGVAVKLAEEYPYIAFFYSRWDSSSPISQTFVARHRDRSSRAPRGYELSF